LTLLKDMGPLLPAGARIDKAFLYPETGHLTFITKDAESFGKCPKYTI
jgi:hypothetical protein